jgi:hypothetical protein
VSVCLSAAGWDNTGFRPKDLRWRVGGIYCLAFLLLGFGYTKAGVLSFLLF